MNITIEDKHTIQIGYVWEKDSKFLVIVDNENGIKYVPDTWLDIFTDDDVFTLIFCYAKTVLNIRIDGYTSTGKLTRLCHADDFYKHYKKNYKLIGASKCREIGLRY